VTWIGARGQNLTGVKRQHPLAAVWRLSVSPRFPLLGLIHDVSVSIAIGCLRSRYSTRIMWPCRQKGHTRNDLPVSVS
jgi:hypothetical protein